MSGAFILLVAVTLLLAFFLLTLRFASGRSLWLQEPVTWFFAFWLAGLILLALPLFRYEESLSLGSGGYILATLCAFGVGCLTAEFSASRLRAEALLAGLARTAAAMARTAPTNEAGNSSGVTRWTTFLLLLGLLGTLLLCINSAVSGGLSLSERIGGDSIAEIREQQLGGVVNAIGPFFGLAGVMASLGLVGLTGYSYRLGRREIQQCRAYGARFLVWAYLSLSLFAALFFLGGRMSFVFCTLAVLIGYAEGRWSVGARVVSRSLNLKQWLLGGASTMALLIFMITAATVFLERRVGDQDPARILFKTHRAHFDLDAANILVSSRTGEYFLVSVSYITTPLPTLVYYLDLHENRMPGPFFGEYSFPAVARWARRAIGDFYPFYWEQARIDLFNPLTSINFGGNVWSTMSRDIVADFGRLGALVFTLALGWFAQSVYIQQRNRPGMASVTLLVILRIIILFSGLVSLFFMSLIYWPLYAAVVAVLVANHRRRKSARVMSIATPWASVSGAKN